MAPTTLSPDYVAQLGLSGAAAGEQHVLTIDVRAVGKDGSMTVSIEPEGAAEPDPSEVDPAMESASMAPAMAKILGKGK